MSDTSPLDHLHPGDMALLNFVESFRITQTWAYSVNRENGFWNGKEALLSTIIGLHPDLRKEAMTQIVLAQFALIHSEPSEGVEAVRKQSPERWASTEKDSLVSELAGTIVRCMDLAAWLNLPLAEAIVAEVNRNSKRGYMHGGKAA
jgi:hypothetical protein